MRGVWSSAEQEEGAVRPAYEDASKNIVPKNECIAAELLKLRGNCSRQSDADWVQHSAQGSSDI